MLLTFSSGERLSWIVLLAVRTGFRQYWGGLVLSSGLMTVVGQRGEAGWPGPVGRWERSVGSGPVGWWPGTLLSYWRCTEEMEDSEGKRRRGV